MWEKQNISPVQEKRLSW